MNCLVLAKVAHVQHSNIYYPSCLQCYSKIFRSDNGWCCVKCQNNIKDQDVSYRYRLCLKICDNKYLCDTTVFGTTLNVFFGGSADMLHRYLEGLAGASDDMLQTSLQEVFQNQMFLFGFKMNTAQSGINSQRHRTLQDILNQHNKVNTNDNTRSLIAYQMIPPSDDMKDRQLTVLDCLKYYMSDKDKTLPPSQPIAQKKNHNVTDTAETSNMSTGRTSLLSDGQSSVMLSCGSISTNSTINDSDTHVEHISSYEVSRNDSGFDCQPSMEVPRATTSVTGRSILKNFELEDLEETVNMTEDLTNSSHRRYIMHSPVGEIKCRQLSMNDSSLKEPDAIPVFKYSLHEEESLSDSILLLNDHIDNVICDSKGINKAETAVSDPHLQPGCTTMQSQEWSSIPESENLEQFLEQMEVTNHKPRSANDDRKSLNPQAYVANKKESSQMFIAMSEDLELFLENVANESTFSKTQDSNQVSENAKVNLETSQCITEPRLTNETLGAQESRPLFVAMSEDLKVSLANTNTNTFSETQGHGQCSQWADVNNESTQCIPESEDLSDSPTENLAQLVMNHDADTRQHETFIEYTDSCSHNTSENYQFSEVCQVNNSNSSEITVHHGVAEDKSASIHAGDELWDEEVTSQQLLDGEAHIPSTKNEEIIKSEDLFTSLKDRKVVESEELFLSSDNLEVLVPLNYDLVQSEELFSSFVYQDKQENISEMSNHVHSEHLFKRGCMSPKPKTEICTSKKGVRFSLCPVHSKTITAIDQQMRTTPISVTRTSKRNPCLKLKLNNDHVTRTQYSQSQELSPDVRSDTSTDLFTPSPIVTNSCLKAGIYQSTPYSDDDDIIPNTPYVSKLKSQNGKCKSQSISAVSPPSEPRHSTSSNSMDLFSDSGMSGHCATEDSDPASNSADLFSSDSWDDRDRTADSLCRKLF